jgi:hypothetical protein
VAKSGCFPIKVRLGVDCPCECRPFPQGLTTMVNSMYNGWRMEDIWLDRWN